ncbi:hypothetical protein PPROV_000664600 [Pycnococcus provasolii]|uniref:Uncharacterized protein n=1 Tax=Pycnococcus provasolii TaxID=41880 RepID=A0A830HL51_9CHLO|nr:hypothetical protein PPROV_000664600 [Pycnococcus provasolii]
MASSPTPEISSRSFMATFRSHVLLAERWNRDVDVSDLEGYAESGARDLGAGAGTSSSTQHAYMRSPVHPSMHPRHPHHVRASSSHPPAQSSPAHDNHFDAQTTGQYSDEMYYHQYYYGGGGQQQQQPHPHPPPPPPHAYYHYFQGGPPPPPPPPPPHWNYYHNQYHAPPPRSPYHHNHYGAHSPPPPHPPPPHHHHHHHAPPPRGEPSPGTRTDAAGLAEFAQALRVTLDKLAEASPELAADGARLFDDDSEVARVCMAWYHAGFATGCARARSGVKKAEREYGKT